MIFLSKNIYMNWYNRQLKIAQSTKHWNADQQRRMPEDIREIYEYYKGEDEPIDRKKQYVLRNERANEMASEDKIRHERRSKVHKHEEIIKELREKLKDLTLPEYQRNDIIKQIGYSTSAISKILNTIPKHLKRKERFGDYY